MLYRLWCFIIFLFNFIPKEQKTILAHVLQISTVSPESFTYNSIDEHWESEKLGIKYYLDTGNVYIRKVKYPLTGKAKRDLTNHFKNINLMIHHQTVGLALLEDSTPTTPVPAVEPDKTKESASTEPKGSWKKNFNLLDYIGKTITVKYKSGCTKEGVVSLRRCFHYPFEFDYSSYTSTGHYYASENKDLKDILAIYDEEY